MASDLDPESRARTRLQRPFRFTFILTVSSSFVTASSKRMPPSVICFTRSNAGERSFHDWTASFVCDLRIEDPFSVKVFKNRQSSICQRAGKYSPHAQVKTHIFCADCSKSDRKEYWLRNWSIVSLCSVKRIPWRLSGFVSIPAPRQPETLPPALPQHFLYFSPLPQGKAYFSLLFPRLNLRILYYNLFILSKLSGGEIR